MFLRCAINCKYWKTRSMRPSVTVMWDSGVKRTWLILDDWQDKIQVGLADAVVTRRRRYRRRFLHELLPVYRRRSINFSVSIRSPRLILNPRATTAGGPPAHCGPDGLFAVSRPINQLSTRRIMQRSTRAFHLQQRCMPFKVVANHRIGWATVSRMLHPSYIFRAYTSSRYQRCCVESMLRYRPTISKWFNCKAIVRRRRSL